MSLAIVVGTGILSFLFLYFAFKLEKKHFILQLTAVVFSVILMFLVSKAALDAQTSCEPILQNQTVTGNMTSFTYTTFCSETNANTGLYSFRTIATFMTIFFIYIFLYIIWETVDYKKIMGGRK